MRQDRRFALTSALASAFALALGTGSAGLAADRPITKEDIDFRSPALIAEALAETWSSATTPLALPRSQARLSGRHGDNIQINDPELDHFRLCPPPLRPLEFSVQSETSMATFGGHIVVGYNSSAGADVDATCRTITRLLTSGYSVSHDGGQTWTSSFVPPAPGARGTSGDPSLGVDRAGNFYYASIGPDAAGRSGVIVNKSTDGGDTFAAAVVVATPAGFSDKEWLAVGPDPDHPDQDNIYVAWTLIKPRGDRPGFRGELWVARSSDGGATWSARSVFAPVDEGPGRMSDGLQFVNPTVDAANGRLYIPFLHFSHTDADLLKVLVSDDGGQTFDFLRFDAPGAPDGSGFPVVTPGTVADCGLFGGVRLVLHQGENLGGGRRDLPRYRQSTRLTAQPSTAVLDGQLFIAFNASTSAAVGDPESRSEIRLLFSPDGGATWADPVTVAAATDEDPQHVLPSLSIDERGKRVHVAYYVQQADERVRVDAAGGEVKDGTVRFDHDRARPVSSLAFDLIPSNNPLPSPPFATANYDVVAPCYDLGEYMATAVIDKYLLVAWGGDRNDWTSPPGSPAAGTHAQPDVFFQRLRR